MKNRTYALLKKTVDHKVYYISYSYTNENTLEIEIKCIDIFTIKELNKKAFTLQNVKIHEYINKIVNAISKGYEIILNKTT